MYNKWLLTKLICAALAFLFCPSCTSRYDAPDIFDTISEGWKNDVTQNGVLGARWRVFDQVEINKTTLEEVRRVYGATPQFRIHDKEQSPFLICYRTLDGIDVIFESGPHGGCTTITAIYIIQERYFSDKRCTRTVAMPMNLSIGDLTLGTNKEAVEKLLGAPQVKEKNFISFQYLEIKNSPEHIDILSGVDIGFGEGGLVIWYHVYYQEST
jgi:hypothetical protein